MGKIKKFTVFCVIAIFSTEVFAKQISFQIVQRNKNLEKVCEESLVVEDSFLTGFFDKGFIVTNSTAAVSSSKKVDEELWYSGLNEAYNGASDYFAQVIVHVSEENSELNNFSGKPVVEKIEWSLCDVQKGEKIISDLVLNVKSANSENDLGMVSYKIVAKITDAIKG